MSLDAALTSIRRNRPRRIVAFTGAGISAESGIPTFRGSTGRWRGYGSEDLATPAAFARDPHLLWEWYEWRRGLIRAASPNRAHAALSKLPQAVVVTQNVDGLHHAAGSPDVIELHGNIFRARCVREGTSRDASPAFPAIPPLCECGSLLRPDVVWFGEALPVEALQRAAAVMSGADLVLIIGTSGVVYPAAGLVALHQGLSIEINPLASALSSSCDHVITAAASEAVPVIVDALLEVVE